MVNPNSLESGIIWFLLISPPLAFLIIGKAPMRSAPMTKIGLIVLGCVICLVIGWFYYLIIQQERQRIKAKMTEVANSMSNVASAVAAYHQEENTWPHCDGVMAIQTSLGVTCPKETTNKISSISVTSPRAEEVIITATIRGIDSRVDGKNLTLTGTQSERDILM
jgi:hypothetical protein